MSRRHKFGDNNKLYFISYAVVYWIDVFVRKEYKDIIIESWKFCQANKGLEIYGWIIMPSHVHMIIGSNTSRLEDIPQTGASMQIIREQAQACLAIIKSN